MYKIIHQIDVVRKVLVVNEPYMVFISYELLRNIAKISLLFWTRSIKFFKAFLFALKKVLLIDLKIHSFLKKKTGFLFLRKFFYL